MGEREDGEAEPGELPAHERKRRRASREPIVWAAPARAASDSLLDAGAARAGADDDTPDGGSPGLGSGVGVAALSPADGGAAAAHARTAAGRAAVELQGFLGRGGATLDLDPDAPPAVKASPSVSPGDAGGGGAGAPGEAEPAGAVAAEDADAAAGPPRPTATSRWLAAEEDNEEEDGSQGAGAALAKAAADAEALQADRAMLDPAAVGPQPSPQPAAATDPASPDAHGAANGDAAEADAPRANMLRECRSVEEFERLNRISEGTYGVVYRWAARSGMLGIRYYYICCYHAVRRRRIDGMHDTNIAFSNFSDILVNIALSRFLTYL